jgi:hypothetical protein
VVVVVVVVVVMVVVMVVVVIVVCVCGGGGEGSKPAQQIGPEQIREFSVVAWLFVCAFIVLFLLLLRVWAEEAAEVFRTPTMISAFNTNIINTHAEFAGSCTTRRSRTAAHANGRVTKISSALATSASAPTTLTLPWI